MRSMQVPAQTVLAGAAARRAWGTARLWGDRARHFARAYWLDIAWAIFVGLNLIAMRLIPAWQTVPFLIIWLSLTTIYGLPLWRRGSTGLTVSGLTPATGGPVGWQGPRGKQDGGHPAGGPPVAAR